MKFFRIWIGHRLPGGFWGGLSFYPRRFRYPQSRPAAPAVPRRNSHWILRLILVWAVVAIVIAYWQWALIGMSVGIGLVLLTRRPKK